jgi:N-methylhydantoinase A/oxoprolinase/acetone carboxylase beta subunit
VSFRIGVDIGGTFTDCVLVDSAGERTVSKALTTHEALVEGVMAALDIQRAGEPILPECTFFRRRRWR